MKTKTQNEQLENIEIMKADAYNGDADALECLAWMYFSGDGVDIDKSRGVELFRQAAAEGSASAQCCLGMFYSEGDGIEENDDKAARFFKLAAESGDSFSQLELGYMYLGGRGVAKNEMIAYKWFLLAEAQAEEGVCHEARSLEDHLSRAEIAEGQKLAREFGLDSQLELLS